jgi:hypothetical protein
MTYIFIIFTILSFIVWIIMLSKHKFQNILHLISVSIVTMTIITKCLISCAIVDVYFAGSFVLYSLGFLIEEYELFEKNLFFINSCNNIPFDSVETSININHIKP